MGRFKRYISALCAFWRLTLHADLNTYYPDSERKSWLTIFLENLKWMITKREVNYFYYLQGCDRKESGNPNNYLALPEFMRLRNRANAGYSAGDRMVHYACLFQDKFLFSQLLKSLNVPVAETIALCDNQSVSWIGQDGNEPIETILQKEGLKAFLKPTVGWQGAGINYLEVQNGTLLIDGNPCSIDEIKQQIKGQCLLQMPVDQHPDMAQLHPNSVNTLRIVTARCDKEIKIISSVCRLGTGASHCDNWSTGGIAVGIDPAAGTFYRMGFFNPLYGRGVMSHPDTKEVFEGFTVPFYQEAVRAASSLHHCLYGIHSVGWDVAITEDGPVFIEGNDDWGIRTIQCHDDGFKKRFLSTLPK